MSPQVRLGILLGLAGLGVLTLVTSLAEATHSENLVLTPTADSLSATATFNVIGSGSRNWTVHWGDGTTTVSSGSGSAGTGIGAKSVSHTYASAGTYTVKVYHRPPTGNDYTDHVLTQTVTVNRFPVLAAIGPRSVDENATLAFSISATDPDGQTLTHSASGLPAGATFTASTRTFSWTTGHLDSGSYPVTFTASDGTATDSETVTITVTDVPATPVLAPVGSKTVAEGADLAFTVTATDPDGPAPTLSATGVPPGASWTPSTGAFSWTPGFTQADSYPITFTASDGVRTDDETILVTVTNVDRAPVLSPVGDRDTAEDATLAFTLSAIDDDGDAVAYSATGLPTGATLTGADFAWRPSFAQAGEHNVTFTATSNGLTDSETVRIMVANVDREPVLDAIGPRTIAENSTLALTLSASDADTDAITYSATGLPTGASLDGASFSWKPSFTQEGDHVVTFTATAGGASDAETVTLTVTNVDRAPVLDALPDATVPEATAYGVTVAAGDADGDPVTLSVDALPPGATFEAPTGEFAWTPDYTQAGVYDVAFTATAGGLSDTATLRITVTETDQPPVLAEIGPKPATENAPLAFTLSAADPDGTAVTFSASGLPTGATLTGADFAWTPSFSQQGAYVVTFTVSSGPATDSEAVTITVANVDRPPVLTAIGPKTVAEDAPLVFDLAANDPDGDAIIFGASGLPAGATLVGARFEWRPSFTQADDHVVTFTATAAGADDAETVTLTVTNVDRAPVVSPLDDAEVEETEALAVTVAAADADGDAVVVSAEDLPEGATFDGSAFAWTPTYAQAGVYDVTFTATAGGLTGTETLHIVVANLDRAPVLDQIGPVSETQEGSAFTLTLAATDPDGDALAFSALGLPTGASLTGAQFSWTPGFDQAGVHTITFQASAGGLADAETVEITVANVDRAPVLATIGPRTVAEDATLTFALAATDADGDAVTYAASGTPAGATLTGATFTWKPSFAQANVYTMTFTASAGGAEDSEQVTITVTDVDRAPTVTPLADRAIGEGSTLFFTVFASDPDGDALTLESSALPAGVAFTPGNGAFSWTPTYEQSGVYDITFTATAAGKTATASVHITVNEVDPAPVLDTIGAQTIDETDTLTFTVSATDADSDTLTFGAAPLPSGATFDATTRTFSWTPWYTQAGSTTVVFSVSDGTSTDTEAVVVTVSDQDRAPTAALAANLATVREGIPVTFTITVADVDGDLVSWTLDPGDGGAALTGSGNGTRAHVYGSPTTATATLTATSKTLTAMEDVAVTVVEDAAPSATLDTSAATGVAPFSPTFSTTASDADGAVVTWTFDPGYGSVQTGSGVPPQQFFPTYDAEGEYVARLTVTDDGGHTVEATTTLTVDAAAVPNRAPLVELVSSSDEPFNATITVHASDPDQDGFVATWTVDWGDETPEETGAGADLPETIRHEYVSGDTYLIKFTATDDVGATRTALSTVQVRGRFAPTIDFSPDAGDAPLDVTFDLDGSFLDSAATITFDPDVGIATTLASLPARINLQYAAGEYDAVLTIDDGVNPAESTTVHISVNDVPTATLVAAETDIDAGDEAILAVSITDGDAVTWTVDFGDGTTPVSGTLKNRIVQHTYRVAGTFAATLQVTDALGSTTSASEVLAVNALPTADLSLTTAGTITAPRSVQFALALSGDAATWALDADGDGDADVTGGADVVSAAFEYTAAGTYEACLTATDDLGATSPEDCLTVEVNDAPTATLTVDDATVDEDVVVGFDVAAVDGDAFSWTLDFGDGTADATGTAANTDVAHTFADGGLYTVTLTVTDAFGVAATDTVDMDVNTLPTVALALATPGTITAPATVAFDVVLSEDVVTWTLEADDGDADADDVGGLQDATASVTFATAGSYAVCLTATDDRGSASFPDCVTVEVNDAPTATLTVGDAALDEDVDPVFRITVVDRDAVTWTLDFGDGTEAAVGTQATATLAHPYADGGAYTATLTVADAFGITAEDAVQIAVNALPAAGLAVTTPDTITAPATVDFALTLSADTVAWTLDADGDGDTDASGGAGQSTASFAYAQPDTYTACLVATDDLGSTSVPACRTVEVNDAPTAALTVDDAAFVEDTEAVFHVAVMDGDAVSWTLDFGDGTTASPSTAAMLEVRHVYADGGRYTATLAATDAFGVPAGDTVEIDVNARPAVALALATEGTITAPQLAQFALTLSADTVAWTLDADGDGDTDASGGAGATAASFTYAQPGTFTPCLAATDAEGDAALPDCTTVEVNDAPVTTLAVDDAAFEEDGEAVFHVAVVDGDAVTWTLDFGDGSTPATGSAHTETVRHVYPEGGLYVATLSAEDAFDVPSSDTVDLAVNARPAAALALTNVDTITAPAPATFALTLSADTVSWTLDPDGDGDVDLTGPGTATSAVWDPSRPGSFTACLVATDAEGSVSPPSCVPVAVNDAPTATLTVEDAAFDEDAQAVFHVTAADGDAFAWSLDFGDGSEPATGTTASETVRHVYADGGPYTATLAVTDEFGVEVADAVDVDVNGRPVAALTVQGEQPFTAPARVRFDLALSEDAVTWRLDTDGDGDADASGLADFLTTAFDYDGEGVFQACLTATDAQGLSSVPSCAAVAVNARPTVSVALRPAASLVAPFLATFDLTFSEDVTAWAFDADGDGTLEAMGDNATAAVVGFTFGAAGTFEACATALDEAGAAAETSCVDVPVVAAPASSGGGGGGGGGGSRGEPIPSGDEETTDPASEETEEREPVTYEGNATVDAEGRTEVDLQEEGGSVDAIEADVEGSAEGVRIVVTEDLTPSDGEIVAFDITATDADGAPARISGATVRFHVPKAKVPEGARVVLVHEGIPVPTTCAEGDDGQVHCSAFVEDFSPFAAVVDREAPRFDSPTPAPASAETSDPGSATVYVSDDVMVAYVNATVDGEPADVDGSRARGTIARIHGPFAPGNHTLNVTATDVAGRVAWLNWTFEVLPAPASDGKDVDDDLDLAADDGRGERPTFPPNAPAAEVAEAVGIGKHDPLVALLGLVEVVGLAAAFRLWGPQIAKVVTRPRIKGSKAVEPPLAELRCDLCLGGFKSTAMLHRCRCGVKLHGSCYVRAGACPGCGSTDGLEIG